MRVCRNLNYLKAILMARYEACLKHVLCIFLVYFQQLANRRWSHSGLRRPIPLIGKRALLPDPTLVGKTTLNHPMVLKRSSSDNELFMRTMRAYEPGTKSNAQFSNKARTQVRFWDLFGFCPVCCPSKQVYNNITLELQLNKV